MRVLFLFLTILATLSTISQAKDLLWVEAESFEETGGWLVDQQFMDLMGSPYLLAHGLGEPVLDATTTLAFPHAGEYRVWVRTRDWVAPWNAPGAPGRFQLVVDGKPLETTFGTEGNDWHWQNGGTVKVNKKAKLALHDLTGFEGRCDAILFSPNLKWVPPDSGQELAQLRGEMLGWTNEPANGGEFDLVVVGGGIAGTSAAITAARLGLKVALVQDRPVLGGNGSSEVRVWPEGKTNLLPYPRVGDVVSELVRDKGKGDGNAGNAQIYNDRRKLDLARAESNLTLMLNHRVNAASAKSDGIRSVVAQHTHSGKRVRVTGKWFLDSTGDAVLGALVGADFEITHTGHLGASNLWNLGAVEQNEYQLKCLCEDDDPLSLNFMPCDKPSPFPRCPWAVDLSDRDFPGRGAWRHSSDATETLRESGATLWVKTQDNDAQDPAANSTDLVCGVMMMTWIREDNPDADDFDRGQFVGAVAGGHALRGLVTFDLSSIPAGVKIPQARVSLLRGAPKANSDQGGLRESTLEVAAVPQQGATKNATWNTYDGKNQWQSPGGDGGDTLATSKSNLTANPAAGGEPVVFESPAIGKAVESAIRRGETKLTLLVTCPEAEAAETRNFYVIGPTNSSTQPSLWNLGGWFWESGFDKDPIYDMEQVRDQNLRAMYGAWDTLKNVDGKFPNHRLKWAAYIAGKRESRRLLGEVVLTGDDFRSQTYFEDAAFPCTWDLDLHVPDPKYTDESFDPFISKAHFGKYQGPYWAPYRCLYSRNVKNLFMAGRDISVTHEALGAVRVMRTCGMMGEIVGMAASICKKHDCDPSQVYSSHLDELKSLMRTGVGKNTAPASTP